MGYLYGTKKNLGQILVEKAHELEPSFNGDGFDDMGEALAIILAHMGEGGGAAYLAGEGISIDEEGRISVTLPFAEDKLF